MSDRRPEGFENRLVEDRRPGYAWPRIHRDVQWTDRRADLRAVLNDVATVIETQLSVYDPPSAKTCWWFNNLQIGTVDNGWWVDVHGSRRAGDDE